MTNIGVVIVSHNSSSVLGFCLKALNSQTIRPNTIAVIDSGSTNTNYLNELEHQIDTLITHTANIGFCRANNIGYRSIKRDNDWILFLNPDAFLPNNWIENAIGILNKENAVKIGCLSGPLRGFSIETSSPTGYIDSHGIYQSPLGFWYDKEQGEPVELNRKQPSIYEPTAICGAMMLCQKSALDNISKPGSDPFDESFFMYKEDIDLSLRLRRSGWLLQISQSLVSYHCRGWKKDRKSMPAYFRKISARNELRIGLKNRSPYIITALLKIFWVKFVER